MFSLSEVHRYYFYQSPTDMRKGFDGLSGLVINALQMDPLSGDVYMFIVKGIDLKSVKHRKRYLLKKT